MRAALAVLAAVQVAIGGWILLAPRAFFANPWVNLHMVYNEHLLLDYGAMNLAMAVLLAFAVRRPPLVVPALATYLVHATIHLVIHTRYVGHLPAGQSALLLTALGTLVVAPVVLLLRARRAAGARSRPTRRPG